MPTPADLPPFTEVFTAPIPDGGVTTLTPAVVGVAPFDGKVVFAEVIVLGHAGSSPGPSDSRRWDLTNGSTAETNVIGTHASPAGEPLGEYRQLLALDPAHVEVSEGDVLVIWNGADDQVAGSGPQADPGIVRVGFARAEG